MTDAEYNLLDEKWIKAISVDGSPVTVSLKEAFHDAHLIRDISGDNAPQDASILRLMLAVMYCVYLREAPDGRNEPMECGSDAIGRWEELWSKGRFDGDQIGRYLESNRDGFFLFHPTNPFYQTIFEGGTSYPASKFNGTISESNHKPRLFLCANGDRKMLMSYADASRWLVYSMGYDDCSAKKPSPKMPWTGNLGMIVIDGHNLFETLMLNFPLANRQSEPYPSETAPWEPGFKRPDVLEKISIPTSPIGILTLQCRHFMLDREDGYVSGVRMMAGAFFDKAGAVIENMVCWRDNKGELMPRLHDPSRSIWRDYQAILLSSYGGSGDLTPGTIEWLSKLVESGVIPKSKLRVKAIGVAYGSMQSTVVDVIDDRILIDSDLLSVLNRSWNERVSDMVGLIDRCSIEFGRFVGTVAELNGRNSDECAMESRTSRSRVYITVDHQFRLWISSIDPEESDEDEMIIKWKDILRKTMIDLGDDVLRNSTPHSRICRKVDSKNVDNAFWAYGRYKKKIYGMTKNEAISNE